MLVVQSILLGIGANALAYMKFMIIRYFGPDETSDLKVNIIYVGTQYYYNNRTLF